MREAIIHRAGVFSEGRQACSECGYLLHRGKEHEKNLPGFPVGEAIYVLADNEGHRALWGERHTPARYADIKSTPCS